MTLKPMLADKARVEAAPAFIRNDEWWMEQKLDGKRILMDARRPIAAPLSRDGTLTACPTNIVAAFSHVNGIFDGELVGTGSDKVLWLFDVLQSGETDLRSQTFAGRRLALEALFNTVEFDSRVRIVPIARTATEKRELFETATRQCAEGVMLKMADAAYAEGLRSPAWKKVKFVDTVDVIVHIVGREGKRSLAVCLINGDGKPIDVGSVTVTERVLSQARQGDVIEVRYLYCNGPDDPRLYQPAFVRFRSDKQWHECTTDQLKFTNRNVIEIGGDA